MTAFFLLLLYFLKMTPLHFLLRALLSFLVYSLEIQNSSVYKDLKILVRKTTVVFNELVFSVYLEISKFLLCIQSAKILLLLPKYKIIMVPSNHSFFLYCDSNIGIFFIASCKFITLIYKIHTKIEAKRLRAITFSIEKLEER